MSPGDQPTSQVKVLEFEDLPPAEPPPDEPNTSNNISDILDEIQFAYNDNDLKPAIACLSFDKRTDKLLETDSAKLPYIFKAEGTSIQQNDIFNCTPDDFELGDISEDKNETFVNGKIAVNKDYEEQQEHSNTEHSVRTSTTTWQPSLQKIPERSKITFDSKILVPNNSNSRKTLQGQLRVTNKALNQHQIAYTDGPTCNTADGKLKQLKQKLFQLSILPSTIKGVYKHHLKIQNDSGANRCVTNVKTLLINFKAIRPYPIAGIKDNEAAIHCTGIGYLPITTDDKETMLIKCYYSPDVSGTIISPTDVVQQNLQRFNAWQFSANLDSGVGRWRLMARDGINHVQLTAYCENNLWWHYSPIPNDNAMKNLQTITGGVVRNLSSHATYQLWHHRLGHPGARVMEMVHKKVKGVPKLHKHHFFNCAACLTKNLRKTHIGERKKYVKEDGGKEV